MLIKIFILKNYILRYAFFALYYLNITVSIAWVISTCLINVIIYSFTELRIKDRPEGIYRFHIKLSRHDGYDVSP